MIPLLKPYVAKDIYLDKIISSGNLAFGENGKLFENNLRIFISNPNILLVNSYQNAFHIALKSLNLRVGDEVLLSPLACLQTTQALKSYGLKLKWVDANIDLATIDFESLSNSINSNTKLVVHNHYCGMVGDIEKISKICKKNNILLIDDAIEAFGSKYNNKYIGNSEFSDATIFSFNPVRNPNAIDGGAISFKNSSSFEYSKLLRDYGIDRNLFRLPNGEINPNYDIKITGYSATISDLNSYIGLMNLKQIDKILKRAQTAATFWTKVLAHNNFDYELFYNKNAIYNQWVFSFKSNNKEAIFNYFRGKGINCSTVHLPNNFYSVFGKKRNLNNVSLLYNSIIALPTLWWLEDEPFNSKINELRRVFF